MYNLMCPFCVRVTCQRRSPYAAAFPRKRRDRASTPRGVQKLRSIEPQRGQYSRKGDRTSRSRRRTAILTWRAKWNGVVSRARRTRAEALERELEVLRRIDGLGNSLTLAELVDEYLAQHDADPVTIEKLRWLLAKATAAFGDRRLV